PVVAAPVHRARSLARRGARGGDEETHDPGDSSRNHDASTPSSGRLDNGVAASHNQVWLMYGRALVPTIAIVGGFTWWLDAVVYASVIADPRAEVAAIESG